MPMAEKSGYLLSRAVRTLAGLLVVVGAMEWHEGVPLAFGVVHLVAFFDGDSVHLNRAPKLGGHEDLGADHLAWKINKQVVI